MRFLLEQCKEHVEAHNTITMQLYQWGRVHNLLITRFPHEFWRKVKSLSYKWEKLWSTYSKIKKLCNQTCASMRDDDERFIWYDQIDEILSLTAKANSVPGVMDQGVSNTGTSNAPTDVREEANGDGEPSWAHSLQCIDLEASSGPDQQRNDTTPRTRASNLARVFEKCTNSTPAKRARIDRNLMDSLDRLADFTTEIE